MGEPGGEVLMDWGEVLTGSLGAGVVIWFLSVVKEGVHDWLEKRRTLRRLRQETKSNREILTSTIGPRASFPCSYFVLSGVLARGMVDVPESEALYNAIMNGRQLYQQLEAFWGRGAELAQTTGYESSQTQEHDELFRFMVREFYVPFLTLGIELLNLELSPKPWGKVKGRKRLVSQQRDLIQRWKEVALSRGIRLDVRQIDLTLQKLSEQA